MRYWFSQLLEGLQNTAHSLCGEKFANGLTLGILYVRTHICPVPIEDVEEVSEDIIEVSVTTVRRPPAFHQDITEAAKKILAEEGMLMFDEAIDLAEVEDTTRGNLDKLSDDDGTIVQLIFQNTDGETRQEILRDSGDIAVWMAGIQDRKKQN